MLSDLLDSLEFNQVVIFVKSVARADQLHWLLESCNFPSMCIHSRMPQEERYDHFCYPVRHVPFRTLFAHPFYPLFYYIVSNGTLASRPFPRESWSPLIFLDVVLIWKELMLSSTMTCQILQILTCTEYVTLSFFSTVWLSDSPLLTRQLNIGRPCWSFWNQGSCYFFCG